MKTKRVLRKILALSTGAAMLGATLTGALALDNTLADYPAPFIKDGVFSGLIVVGANAAASDNIGQSIILNDLATKAVTKVSGSGTVSVAGGKSDDIPLGANVSDSASYTFDQELQDDDISSMFDGTISFASSDYDTSEDLVINQAGNSLTVETSLTSSEDDYQTDIVLEATRDSIKYYYVFDETIQVNASTSAAPLEIKFLGKTLKITSVTSDVDNKFTATVGTEYFMNVEDSVEVLGKKVTLKNVGSDGNVVVDIAGTQETVGSTTKTVNGIEVKVDTTFYTSDTKAERSATLILGKDATESYTDGDAYIGEDTDNPNWVWNVNNLNSKLATTTSATAEFLGPYLGIENDFIFNDDSDNPPTVGECIDLPNNYISICLDSLTVADSNYATYTFEYENSADLSYAIGVASAQTIYIHTSQSEGLVVDGSDLSAFNGTAADLKVEKIWLYKEAGAGQGVGLANGGNSTSVGIYYQDVNDNKVKLAGTVSNETSVYFAHINYDNTKDTDVRLQLDMGWDALATIMNISLVPFHSTDLPDYNDNITMNWGMSSEKFSSLGATASSEEAIELQWGGGLTTNPISLGTKDEDHRSRYGIIIRDPKAHGSSDEVVLEIPGDQLQANVIIKGSAATTSTAGGSVRINPIPSSVAVMDSEVTSATAQNLIVVGGPAVNKLAASVFGLSVADFTPNEAMIKLVANGEKAALLVAGYEAVDTRNAATAVANGKLVGKAKVDAVVKSTQLNEYTVE